MTQDLRVGGKNHGRVASELQPNPELRIESTPINFGYLTDHLSDQAVMHCSQLRFHPARHVEAGPLPFLEGSIPVERLGRDRNHEEVARKRTQSHNDGGPDLAAVEVCKWYRQQDDIIS